jgi:hypothetical protein
MQPFRRDLVSLLAAWAFISATTVIPVLHLAFHSRPHSHSASGVHYHHTAGEPAASHDHSQSHASLPDTSHHHQHGRPSNSDLPVVPERDHGTGSAAHFALALSDGPASVAPLFTPVLKEAERLAAAHAAPFLSRDGGTLYLRGPPAAV